MPEMKSIVFQLMILLAFVFPAGAAQDSNARKGEQILKAMSDKLAAARAFSFSTTEIRNEINRQGQRVEIHATRDVIVRRPDGFWTKFTGGRDWEIWYDGKMVTAISPEKKIYIQHEMPPTLDETMNTLAQRFNMDLPMSDVLYSSPYQAFMGPETKGGFAGKVEMGAAKCNLLIYSSPGVDWQLWVDDATSLPCRLEMTYKKQTEHTFYRITFSSWNLSPEVQAEVFASKIPEGFVRIPMLERVAVRRAQPQTQPQTQTAPADSQK